jgi:hypothetical protein
MYNATTAHAFDTALMLAQVVRPLVLVNTTPSWEIASRPNVEFYLHEDSLSGFAISGSGELLGVFSRVKGRGDGLMVHALYRGATHLDCFEGYLPAFYAKHGFVEVGSERNYGGDHLPRVVYMALRGNTHSALNSGTDA